MNSTNRKGKVYKIVLIVVQVLLMAWLIILALCEPDHVGAIQIVIGIVGLVVALIGLRTPYKKEILISAIVIFVIEVVVLGVWSLRLLNKPDGKKEMQSSEEVGVGKTKGSGGDMEVQSMEKELKDFDLKSDLYLKDLDEYTNADGTESEKITKVVEEKLHHWMKGYDTLSVGKSSDECTSIRGKADEIYTICCLPQRDSKYLQDKAVESYDNYINELEELYKKSENPEVKKEIANAYIDLGDLHQKLGQKNEARDCYTKTIEVGWDGVEMSIKYGMQTNAKDIFGIQSKAYENISVLSWVDEWDRERAKEMSGIFDGLAENFDSVFLKDID